MAKPMVSQVSRSVLTSDMSAFCIRGILSFKLEYKMFARELSLQRTK